MKILQILSSLILISICSPSWAEPKPIRCPQPLPEFTLGEKSNPSQRQIESLCECIWDKFPSDGWEREASALITKGKDPGFVKRNGFIGRFSEALNKCGGYKL